MAMNANDALKDLAGSDNGKVNASFDVRKIANVRMNADDVSELENTETVRKNNTKGLNKLTTIGDKENPPVKNEIPSRGEGDKVLEQEGTSTETRMEGATASIVDLLDKGSRLLMGCKN